MDEQRIKAVKKDKNDNCINQCDSRIKYKEQNKEKMEKNNQKTWATNELSLILQAEAVPHYVQWGHMPARTEL